MKKFILLIPILLLTACVPLPEKCEFEGELITCPDNPCDLCDSSEECNILEKAPPIVKCFTEEPTELTIPQKIEDLSLYKTVTQEEIDSLHECRKVNLSNLAEVKKLSLFEGVEQFSVTIYQVPSEYENKCEEIGSFRTLKKTENYTLVWDPLGCGWEVGEFFENETDDSKACSVINDQVFEYEDLYR